MSSGFLIKLLIDMISPELQRAEINAPRVIGLGLGFLHTQLDRLFDVKSAYHTRRRTDAGFTFPDRG